jgi:hypothetical protein
MKATATFSPTRWDEKPYEQISPTTKMTKASVEFAVKGELEGVALVEYLMYYSDYDDRDPHKSTAFYIGLTRFKGTIHGKSGSFVTEDLGKFDAGAATTKSTILPGSGTGELRGIAGSATSSATQQGSKFDLDYSLNTR